MIRPTLALFFGMGIGELMLLGIVAVLLYGKRLPDVAKDFGKQYHQFKRGLQDMQAEMSKATSEVDRTMRDAKQQLLTFDDDDEPTAPQFTAPPAEDA